MQKKILIAYYSWSGNTEKIALKLQKATGGDVFAIRPLEEYPSDYQRTVQQAKKEIAEGFVPEIAGDVDLAPYDVVLLGTPNWWSTAAPPVSSFLRKKDFTGKTVAPFSTHGGGGMARTVSDMASLCKNAHVLEGLSIYNAGDRSTDGELAVWLKKAGI